ncbi:hypothetical protein BGW80DRAFT_1316573, partial [Lactifluus volemus]
MSMWSLARLIQPAARNEYISSWVLKSARGLKSDSEPSGFRSCGSSTLVGSVCWGRGSWGAGIIQGWDEKTETCTGPPARPAPAET